MFANHCYHVLNRANWRAEIFHDLSDYRAFVSLMAKTQQRLELPILAACLMPNHLHFVVRPNDDNDVARWTQWLFTTHVRHYHENTIRLGACGKAGTRPSFCSTITIF